MRMTVVGSLLQQLPRVCVGREGRGRDRMEERKDRSLGGKGEVKRGPRNSREKRVPGCQGVCACGRHQKRGKRTGMKGRTKERGRERESRVLSIETSSYQVLSLN